MNLQKAAEIVLYEFRAGTIGRITLELPEEYAAWAEVAWRIEEERQQQKAGRKGPASIEDEDDQDSA